MGQKLVGKDKELEERDRELSRKDEAMKNLKQLFESEKLLRSELESTLSSICLPANANENGKVLQEVTTFKISPVSLPQISPVALRYQKTRSGADMAGELYEVMLTALLFLHSVYHTQHFFLASNLQPADKFDDLVYRYKSDVTYDWRTCLIQRKHSESKINCGQLLSIGKSTFGLIKYCKCNSYLTVKDDHKSNTDLQFLGDFNEFEFILYSNVSVDALDETESLQSLISTGKQGRAYSLIAKSDPDIFEAFKEMALF